MVGLLIRSLRGTRPSIALSPTILVGLSLLSKRIRQRTCIKLDLGSRKLSTFLWRRQYQTRGDTSKRNPLVNIRSREPLFFRRASRFTARAIGGILIITFVSVIALVIYEPRTIATSEGSRMAAQSKECVSDDETETLEIEAYIQNHPVVQKLRQQKGLVESRPHLDISVIFRPNNLIAGALTGRKRITVPPLFFADSQGKKLYAILYIGDQLCSHPGIVHGGLLATLMDEALARCSFLALPSGVSMTANLVVRYQAPCEVNRFVLIKAETTSVEGRKAWVSGRLESLPEPGIEGDGELFVEASALMIEPKVIGPLMKVIPLNHLNRPNPTVDSS